MIAIRRLAVRPSAHLIRPALQIAAAGGAAFFAYRAFHLYRESNTQFDEAVFWLGLSIALALVMGAASLVGVIILLVGGD